MEKYLIYIISITDTSAKIDHSKYSGYCIKSWEYYCKKHNIDLHIVTENDPRCGRPIWNKELIFEFLKKRKNKKYTKIGIVDADTMIRWDAPNVFEYFDEDFCMIKDDVNWGWVYESIYKYKKFFNIDLDIDEYGNAGVIFFHRKHVGVFEDLFNFYQTNKEELDNWNKGGGREQTLLNFFIKLNRIRIKWLSPAWNVLGLKRRGWVLHNFQLKTNMPHFIKYSYIWHFTGFPIEERIETIKQTWNLIKNNYYD